MSDEKYSLTGHNYSDHLKNVLKDMKTHEAFADVTLVTDDKKQIKAHRSILSSCSSVFKEIFQINTNNNHPVIYLSGIEHSEMETILQLIYVGRAKFCAERVDELLLVAKTFDIQLVERSVVEDSTVHSELTKDKLPIKVEEEYQEIPIHQDHVDIKLDTNMKTISSVKHKKFQCQQCDTFYTRNSSLTYHIQSKHEGAKYVCNQCDKQYTAQDNLTRHILSIHENSKYGCNQCDKQYSKQSELTIHKFAHKGQFVCNQCDKQFTLQSSLTAHIQSAHKGVKYACNQRDKQYAKQSELTIHKYAHEGVKYGCNECEKVYTDQSTLSRHIRSVHEGLMYACDQCDYRTTRLDSLAKHNKSAHEGVRYACNQCELQFTQKQNVRKHIQSAHKSFKYEGMKIYNL